ncbi:DUF418 domain-containing protein [Flavihumibacter petaseus]|uniref:DUF418 domain-containing protein n=1 Tax=Flavihumibacter petaseus NBRC 106054 TaxID=1220578 RepID=A0A0E9N1B7_9BACT|nr:DUF418 domain-containing protein [Flavihumibacter petaseus]GAO43538.1 hypothetical protein FPE01S_02_06430 [Flavihumibacter petaseus NBRC 106054]
MTTPNHLPQPVAKAERIRTIDMIRGVALLGILLMNIPGFGMHWSNFITILKGSRINADYQTFLVVITFFEGTMRGLFSMLFGAGMILFMRNKEDAPGGATVSEYYFRRLLWLVGFGLINAFIFLWNGDILFFYGLCGMLLFPFRNLAPAKLVVVVLVCLGVGMLKQQASHNDLQDKRVAFLEAKKAEKAHRTLTADQKEAISAWQGIEKNYFTFDSAQAKKDIAKMHGSYGSVYRFLIPQNANIETFLTYHGSWDILTMMFLGMALFGWGYFSDKCSSGTYALGVLIGYGFGFLVSWTHFKGLYQDGLNLGAYVDRYRVTHQLLYDLKRMFISTGHAALVILVFRSRLVPWLMHALGCVGQMAFTNYLMQSIICSTFFDGFGLDQYHRLRFYQLYYVVGSVWLFQLIVSPIWLHYFRFGPFEWLWRSLTYWKLQPMRLAPKVQAPPYEAPQLAS